VFFVTFGFWVRRRRATDPRIIHFGVITPSRRHLPEMHNVSRVQVLVFGCLLMLSLSAPALAQPSFDTTYQTVDFSGEWSELAYEGAFQYDLGDYSGVPLNAAGRMRADSHDHTE
jgi:hypothetical protein